MALNKARYINAVIYFAHHANNEHLGKVKLMKLLYYLDFDHFEKHGSSVTGDTYRKLDFGPVPLHGEAMLIQMSEEGLIKIDKVAVGDVQKYRYTPLKEFDADALSPTEMEILADVACKWEHHTRAEIVSAAHGEAPWKAVAMGEEIPYELAYYRNKYPATETIEDKEPNITVEDAAA